MENEELIRHQMQSKRAALTEKLESLEEKVVDTVQDATSAVSDTVENIKDSVQDTVATVKDTVEDTVSSVKETVHDGVETVKDWLDVKAHVQDHPWLMVSGSAVLGYWLGSLLKSAPIENSPPQESAKLSQPGNGHHRDKRHGNSSPAPKKGSDLGPELNKLKGLALGALLGTARDIIVPEMPEAVQAPLTEIIDSITKKIGGEPVKQAEEQTGPEDKPREENLSEAQKGHQKRFTYP